MFTLKMQLRRRRNGRVKKTGGCQNVDVDVKTILESVSASQF